MSTIDLTKTDGTPLGVLTFDVQRGIDSAHQEILVTNNGIAAVDGLYLIMLAETAPGTGFYAPSGNAIVNEIMGRAQITAVDSSGTAGQTFVAGQVQRLGYLANGMLPTILAGDSVTVEVWIAQAGSSAGGGAVNIMFWVAGESAALPLPDGVTAVGRGIDGGTNQAQSYFINGMLVTPTGTPDDKVHAALGNYLFDGVELSTTAQALTLNQNDGAAAALTTGQEYIAAISQGASATPSVTKGLRATAGSAVAPDVPNGELLRAIVSVKYGASGSVIAGADMSSTAILYGRFLGIAPASGLSIDIYPGQALLANFRQIHSKKDTLTLAASATNHVWLTPAGAFVANTSASQPVPGALQLYTAVTDGTHVTTLTDTRQYLGATGGGVAPHAASHASGGTDPVTPAAIGAAPLASPGLTGTPTAPTAAPGTNTTQLATTAFVTAATVAGTPKSWHPAILFTGNSSSQPSTIAAKPAVDDLFVWRDGLLLVHDPADAGAQDYNYNATTGQITTTPVTPTGKVLQIRYVS